MGLRSRDINAIGGAFDNMDEKIRIGLLVRGFAAVAFDVGHGTADDKIAAVHFG